jgi:hypothetical protein
MEHEERLEKYAIQAAMRQAGPGKKFVALASEDNPLLTPAMRRRLKHKKHVAHSHLDLDVVVDLDGNPRRLPCHLCRSRPNRHFIWQPTPR